MKVHSGSQFIPHAPDPAQGDSWTPSYSGSKSLLTIIKSGALCRICVVLAGVRYAASGPSYSGLMGESQDDMVKFK